MSDVNNEVKKIETAVLLQNVVKLIPMEIVGLFAFIKGLIPVTADPVAVLVTFGALFIFTPFYYIFAMKVTNISQIVLMTIAFPIWVISLGGLPLGSIGWYEPWMVSVGLALFTLVPPMFYGRRVSTEEITTAASDKAENVVKKKSWREV